KLSLTAPTGVDSHGWGIELKGIVTKSIGRLSFHFNGGYEFLTDSTRTERDGRYELALGASYPIGAPKFTLATLVADGFADQPANRGESTIVGTEAGLRYQLTPSIVWDVGIGTEFAGPVSRPVFFATTGFSGGSDGQCQVRQLHLVVEAVPQQTRIWPCFGRERDPTSPSRKG